MTPVEALNLALQKENSSIKLYTDLSNKLPEIRQLLLFLINEEEKHKKMVEDKIVEVTKY